MQSHPLHRKRFSQYQVRWGDREMGTAISFTECSQVAGLIQKFIETPFVQRSCVAIVIVDCHVYVLSVRKRVHARAYRGAGGTGSINGY